MTRMGLRINTLLMAALLSIGCSQQPKEQIQEPVEVNQSQEEASNYGSEIEMAQVDSSLKEENCAIAVKAIETHDHHGNPLLIMRSSTEDYMDPSQGFAVLSLDEERINAMTGKSYQEGSPVSLEDLRYLQVLYKGLDHNVHIGGLIVHYKVAEELLDIFKELYDADYPMDKIRPIYHYEANDDVSMEDNNTSAYTFRVVSGSTHLSKHSYGIALDINPIQNPFVQGDHVSPEAGQAYMDRNLPQPGMILEGDPCHQAFKSRGWTWGGDWNTKTDYQHFQKNIDLCQVTSTP